MFLQAANGIVSEHFFTISYGAYDSLTDHSEQGITVRAAIHPGEHLADALNEIGMSAAELARQLKVPTNRITGILNGERAVTADTALRLSHWLGMSPDF
jgi:addiction module HigA family antidote